MSDLSELNKWVTYCTRRYQGLPLKKGAALERLLRELNAVADEGMLPTRSALAEAVQDAMASLGYSATQASD